MSRLHRRWVTAALTDDMTLLEQILDFRPDVLDAECEVDVGGTPTSLTALHAAVIGGNLKMVMFLVKAGADIEHTNVSTDLKSPLHSALRHEQVNIMKLLIKRGASLMIVDGKSLLEVADSSSLVGVCQMLAREGLDTTINYSRGSEFNSQRRHRYRIYGAVRRGLVERSTELAVLLDACGLANDGIDGVIMNYLPCAPLNVALSEWHIDTIHATITKKSMGSVSKHSDTCLNIFTLPSASAQSTVADIRHQSGSDGGGDGDGDGDGGSENEGDMSGSIYARESRDNGNSQNYCERLAFCRNAVNCHGNVNMTANVKDKTRDVKDVNAGEYHVNRTKDNVDKSEKDDTDCSSNDEKEATVKNDKHEDGKAEQEIIHRYEYEDGDGTDDWSDWSDEVQPLENKNKLSEKDKEAFVNGEGPAWWSGDEEDVDDPDNIDDFQIPYEKRWTHDKVKARTIVINDRRLPLF